MKSSFGNSGRIFFSNARPVNGTVAFTLTELLVIIATTALLAATLLPALAGTRFRTSLAMCTANCRQWGVAMMSYSVDHNSYFPNEPLPATAGGDVWDVASQYITDMNAYGMNKPAMWFCPCRPWAYQSANAWCVQHLGHPMTTVTNDFALAYAYPIPGSPSAFENLAGSSAVGGSSGYELWVKRPWQTGAGSAYFPSKYIPNGSLNPHANTPYEWLQRPSDPHASEMPILTDVVISSYTSPAFLNVKGVQAVLPGQGHPAGLSQNGAIQNLNLVLGDGHVETHQRQDIHWRYISSAAPYSSFY